MYLLGRLTLTCLVSLLSWEKSFGWEDEEDVDRLRYCRQVPANIDAGVNKIGYITSPFYGERNYPDNVRCYWDIHIPAGYRVKATILDLDLEPSFSCQNDFVDFYGTGAYDFITSICGTNIPFPILSRRGENKFRISFKSDMYGSGRGFRFRYDLIPDGEDCPAGQVLCKNRNCVPDSKKCDGIDDCLDGTDEQGCGYPVRATEECGRPFYKPKTIHEESPDRIIGGEEAIPHSWPWHVSLDVNFWDAPTSHVCGGALINSQWVLTATHCVGWGRENYKIHIGAHNLYKKVEGEQIRYAERIIGYPDLEGEALKTYRVDIALIKLNAPVNLTKTVLPACLPSQGLDLPAGTDCYATGWGTTKGTGFFARLKQTLQTIHKDNCNHKPVQEVCLKPRENYNLPCSGDSGGPLNCKLGEKWYLMGDASYVSGYGVCGMPGTSVTYISVSDKVDWIKKTVDKFS